jgi:hypothetical protein
MNEYLENQLDVLIELITQFSEASDNSRIPFSYRESNHATND